MSQKPKKELHTEESLRPHIIKGSLWMISMRWVMRFIGLISTMLLARLLMPEDFGIIALSMIIVGFIEVFLESGQQSALIRMDSPDEAHYDTAWTMSIISGFVLSCIIFLSAPFIEMIYHEPKVTTVIQILSLRVFITSCENIRLTQFRKNLDFHKDFQFNVLKKLANLFCLIGFALWFRNYYALAFGMVSAPIVSTILSYIMIPIRPRFTLSKLHDLFGFSFWVLLHSICNFLNQKLDQFFLSFFTTTAFIGQYNVASELAKMPTEELVVPLTRSLLPTYAKLQNNKNELKKAYLNVLSTVSFISFSTSFGIAALSKNFVLIVLGSQWVEMIPFIPWLAITSGFYTYQNTTSMVLLAAGYARKNTIQNWARLFALSLLFLGVLYFTRDPMLCIISRFFMIASLSLFYFKNLKDVLDFRYREILSISWSPILAGTLMLVVLDFIPPLDNLYLDTVYKITLGIIIFFTVSIINWLIKGKPSGFENMIFKKFRNILYEQ